MTRERIVLSLIGADPADRNGIMDRARSRGFTQFVVPDAMDLAPRPGETIYSGGVDSLVPRASGADGRPVPIRQVATPQELDRALVEVSRGGRVVIRWSGDRIIPLENAVARRNGHFEVWVVTDRVGDIPGALGALEHGADRVVVELSEPGALDLIEAQLEVVRPPTTAWELATVTRSVAAGIGDRVIVDTTSILRPSEGLLVGSVAGFLFLVASEAEGSAFTRPRAFRVNAGAAHSYVLLSDGTTRYLSELGAGDSVLVGDPVTAFRSARVGRIKTERRPLRLVEAERLDRRYTIFVQDAETVRLSGESGRIPTHEIRVGDRVLGLALPPARHLGTPVDETIDER